MTAHEEAMQWFRANIEAVILDAATCTPLTVSLAAKLAGTSRLTASKVLHELVTRGELREQAAGGIRLFLKK